MFKRYTAFIVGNKRRLLLINNYNSYINLQFVKECDKLRIILIILFFYFIHRLQPLNVGLFSLLFIKYTNKLNMLIFNSLKLISIFKKVF